MPGPNTTAVHAGETPDERFGGVNQEVVHSTTFRFPEQEAAAADGEPARWEASPYIYTRYANPTIESVETKLAALEEVPDGGGAFLFASGMGAEQAVLQAFVPDRGRVALVAGAYGGTAALLAEVFAPRGITTVPVAPDAVEVPPDTDVVWMESITNPLLRVPDIAAWAEATHAAGARLAVDATFASPVLQRPLALGADVVVHSATKYLNGHSDVTAGAVVYRHDDRDALWKQRRNLGATLDPLAAYLVGRGMKTLPLRMQAHCANALRLAHDVADHAAVKAVHHPGLRSHPDHDVARRVLDGFGGMLSLDLGSFAAARAFRRAVKLVLPAASLGGVESLVSLPLETSHRYTPAAERQALGIGDGLVRISVGLEDPEDLAADVIAALDAAAKG
jgi:cystathionine beta-lyase/cystathionine gamma-synthase